MKSTPYLFMLFCLLPILSAADQYFYQNGKKIPLSPIQKQVTTPQSSASTLTRSSDNQSDNLLYYTDSEGRELGVTNRIILKVKGGTDINSLFSAYNLHLHKNLKNGIYSVTTPSADEVVDLANTLYELTDIEYAHPDFYIQIKRR